MGPATPMAPRSSSAASVVAAVAPEDGVVLLPVAVCVWSSALVGERPENSFALRARTEALGWVTVIVSPLTSAVTLCAARMTVRTFEALVMSAARE